MEQRRGRRFRLQLPLSITRVGTQQLALDGLTKNISSSGVLFTAQGDASPRGPIEYVITLNRDSGQSVNLRCIGKVVRTERVIPPGGIAVEMPAFQVAATLERYEFFRVA